MGKRIDPNVSELVMFGVEKTCEGIVCAFYQVSVALVVCIG
jgi:hypothetical protein